MGNRETGAMIVAAIAALGVALICTGFAAGNSSAIGNACVLSGMLLFGAAVLCSVGIENGQAESDLKSDLEKFIVCVNKGGRCEIRGYRLKCVGDILRVRSPEKVLYKYTIRRSGRVVFFDTPEVHEPGDFDRVVRDIRSYKHHEFKMQDGGSFRIAHTGHGFFFECGLMQLWFKLESARQTKCRD